jgi:acyl carrier protein
MSAIEVTIREVIETHGRMPVSVDSLSETEDLFEAGLTSHASVNVMLALEDEFEIEFPDSLLNKTTFESIANIAGALVSLGVVASPS